MSRLKPKWIYLGSLVLLGVVAAFAISVLSQSKPMPKGLVAQYVGRHSCVSCHANEAKLYEGSHHDLAMDVATESTVLGDFDDASLEHHGMTSKMFRRDGRFFINTEAPDGTLADFEVKYVFGVTPLQQYMVEMERPLEKAADSSRKKASGLEQPALGKLQVLRVSWDTKAKKWFHLDPPDVHDRLAVTDSLHWTGIAQQWNTMCADCHSTNLVKGFDVEADKFHTTFSEIDVSCESCHGPGSIHVELAGRTFGKWSTEYGTGLAKLKESAQNQIEACAPCHSRRQALAEGFRAGDKFYDFYTDSLLVEHVYFADGQVQDEDYIHGSFIQSKMYHKGIRCTDCHDPHTARLKHTGNQVCTSCHQHPAAKYDSVAHHFHVPGKPGANCVDCHMPPTTYMEVDPRHDHSLRIPRPDLSVQIGTPNACTGCHIDKTKLPQSKRDGLNQYLDWMTAAANGDQEIKAELGRVDQWADAACEKWYGAQRRKDSHFGQALHAAREKLPEARDLLVALLAKRGEAAPAIARATALQELLNVAPESAAVEAPRNLNDDHPLVRAAAIAATAAIADPGKRVLLVQSALKDPSRLVRIGAARAIAESGPGLQGQVNSAAYQSALAELKGSLHAMRERAGANLALGVLDEQHGRLQSAVKHYEAAMRIEPLTTGPRTNLASLLERMADQMVMDSGTDPETVRQSKQLASSLRDRAKKLQTEELPLLQRDATLLPKDAHLQYRLGLAQYLAGDLASAELSVANALQLEPKIADYYVMLALLQEKKGDLTAARETVRQGLLNQPTNPTLEELQRKFIQP